MVVKKTIKIVVLKRGKAKVMNLCSSGGGG